MISLEQSSCNKKFKFGMKKYITATPANSKRFSKEKTQNLKMIT